MRSTIPTAVQRTGFGNLSTLTDFDPSLWWSPVSFGPRVPLKLYGESVGPPSQSLRRTTPRPQVPTPPPTSLSTPRRSHLYHESRGPEPHPC